MFAAGVDGDLLDDVLRQRRDLPRRRHVVRVAQPQAAVGALAARVHAALLFKSIRLNDMGAIALTVSLNIVINKCTLTQPLTKLIGPLKL